MNTPRSLKAIENDVLLCSILLAAVMSPEVKCAQYVPIQKPNTFYPVTRDGDRAGFLRRLHDRDKLSCRWQFAGG